MTQTANSPAPSNITLAQIEAAQKESPLYAFDKGSSERQVIRLQASYTRKLAELQAVYSMFEDTNPDFALRAPDGQEVVLRIPLSLTGAIKAALETALETQLNGLEIEIISAHLDIEEEAKMREEEGMQASENLKLAILRYCQPAAVVTQSTL